MKIDINLSGLKQLQSQIHQLGEKTGEFCDRCADRLAGELMTRAIERTPVDTGHLRRSYHVIRDNHGREYARIVANNVEYAPYVEYGHRQEVGRFVPAIGKRLVREFVPGKHMLTNAAEDVRQIAPDLIEEELKTFAERLK